jgi:hypothetical protein
MKPGGPRNQSVLALGAVLLLAGGFVVLRLMGGDTGLPSLATEGTPEPASRRDLPHPAAVRPASREAVVDPPPEPTPGGGPAVAPTPGRVDPQAAVRRAMRAIELGQLEGRWMEVSASAPADAWQLEGSGTLRVTYPDGTPMLEGQFVDGKREGTWTRWHPDGRLKSKVSYLRGVPHGEWLEYHRSGMIAERRTFDSGRAEGPATAWHENGQIREQGTWAAGQRHGTWTWFDEQGRLLREERWNAGARIGPIAMFEPGAEPAVERERERRATVDGRYSRLLRRIAAPDDKAQYGEFHDYGHYQPIAEYQGEAAVPEGHWVYVHPYWYIWGRRGGEGR